MNKERDFSKIFKDTFHVSREWDEWFLTTVVPQGRIAGVEADGKTVSVLLSSPYVMSFHRRPLQTSYWSCVATTFSERGKGYMGRLMHESLKRAYDDGDAIVTLIPATRRLYFFYARYGFASAFYVDTQRYTSLHKFKMYDSFTPVDPSYELFESLEQLSPDGVRHSRSDFINVLQDLDIDRGKVVAVTSPDGGAALAAVSIDDTATVKLLMSTDTVAAESVLAQVRNEVGEKPIAVWAHPGDRSAGLQVRGMARIVNAETVLGQLAAAFPKLKYTIKLSDNILEANNGIFRITDALVYRMSDEEYKGRIDLEVSVRVLCEILMSAPHIADIFGLPGARPSISLMLE